MNERHYILLSFITFDVVGLYPHIPQEECLETMKRCLDKQDISVSSGKPARLILMHNYFKLGQVVHHQV